MVQPAGDADRRLGVAVSAPYAHFADREDLLAAVAVRAYEMFTDSVLPEMDKHADPASRLAAMARGYVRLAAYHRPLFEVLYEAGLDKVSSKESRQITSQRTEINDLKSLNSFDQVFDQAAAPIVLRNLLADSELTLGLAGCASFAEVTRDNLMAASVFTAPSQA